MTTLPQAQQKGERPRRQIAVFIAAALLLALAVTFAVIWLRHDKPWAKIVTMLLALVAFASVFFASYSQIFWPVAIILAGIYLFYTALRPRKMV